MASSPARRVAAFRRQLLRIDRISVCSTSVNSAGSTFAPLTYSLCANGLWENCFVQSPRTCRATTTSPSTCRLHAARGAGGGHQRRPDLFDQLLPERDDRHPATDGSRLPIVALWRQLIKQVRPSLVITTGTAGGVGADTVLGDVVVARHVRWDCTKQFSHKPFAHSEYVSGATVDPAEFTLVEQTLMPVNAKKLPPGNRPLRVWLDSDATPAGALSTDFFAFDDAADHYGLRTVDPTARAVEMDDAALGLALADAASPPEWLSVRNASDPQMDGPDLATETAQAAAIYEKYGQITSWGSALVCWALIANRAELLGCRDFGAVSVAAGMGTRRNPSVLAVQGVHGLDAGLQLTRVAAAIGGPPQMRRSSLWIQPCGLPVRWCAIDTSALSSRRSSRS